MTAQGLTLDAGALIAIERGNIFVRRLIERALEERRPVHVVPGVLAQAWRGGPRQAALAAMLGRDGITLKSLEPDTAKLLGAVIGATGHPDVTDVHVAVDARRHRHAVMTSDPDDIRAVDPAPDHHHGLSLDPVVTAFDVVVVDHHDSYTWNLVHLIAGVTGELPTVVEHDEVTAAQVLEHAYVVLSPGPGNPAIERDFSIGREVVLAGTRPVLGVCLGMQGIVTAYGGRVDRVPPGHGVAATVRHDGTGLFAGVPDSFEATRYHSLAALDLPDVLRVTATDERSGLVMAVAHAELPIVGVQFHPESVLTEHGALLVTNFLGAWR